MMKVYELTLAEGQEWTMPKVLEDNYVLSDLRGQRQLHWTPIGMDFLTEDDKGTPRGYSDFPWYDSHVLMLRSDAANSLRETMKLYGEFLPLKGGDGLELFNATTVLDALDENRSEIIRFDAVPPIAGKDHGHCGFDLVRYCVPSGVLNSMPFLAISK